MALPDGALVISVLRDGSGFVPKADTVVEAGDEVLVVLDPGLEPAITQEFVGDERRWLTPTRLIVGAGAAGAACAEALREGGFDGSVVLAGRDVDPPYERPYCSKDYLRGDVSREETYLALPDGLDLRIRTSVMKLDPAARTAKLSSGEELTFGQAVLATGANVRRLRVDGAELEGIHYLRALGNADAIRADAAKDAERVVLIGGSYIACEVAASLTAQGWRCTLVMQEELPLSLGFGRTAGEFFAGVLREPRRRLGRGDALGRFEGDGERVRRVVTASGRELPADLVVMGTGAVPDVMLARSAGLELGETGGIACSSSLETSAEGVWAAGDACEYDSVVHGRRAADRALGGRARPGRRGRGRDRGRARALRRGSVLLVGPGRLVHAGVRRPGCPSGTARWSAARSTTASSRSSTSTASRVRRRRSPSAARTTSTARAS